jgi:uncharacterized protein
MTALPSPFADVITTEDELRTLYRAPSDLVRGKKVPRIDAQAGRFIAGSPFCLLATANTAGHCDVSPRGGPPGFVRVLDEHHLALPDLSGNNLLDSLTNVVANPHAGLLFVIPGRDETLRVEGDACLTTDTDVLRLWDDELRRPKVAIGIAVRTAYIHCAKSFRRGRVWDAESWPELAGAPDICDVILDQVGSDIAPEVVRDALEQGYAFDLMEERTKRGPE